MPNDSTNALNHAYHAAMHASRLSGSAGSQLLAVSETAHTMSGRLDFAGLLDGAAIATAATHAAAAAAAQIRRLYRQIALERHLAGKITTNTRALIDVLAWHERAVSTRDPRFAPAGAIGGEPITATLQWNSGADDEDAACGWEALITPTDAFAAFNPELLGQAPVYAFLEDAALDLAMVGFLDWSGSGDAYQQATAIPADGNYAPVIRIIDGRAVVATTIFVVDHVWREAINADELADQALAEVREQIAAGRVEGPWPCPQDLYRRARWES